MEPEGDPGIRCGVDLLGGAEVFDRPVRNLSPFGKAAAEEHRGEVAKAGGDDPEARGNL